MAGGGERRPPRRLDAVAQDAKGPERRAADLSAAGIDGVNLHWTDWTLGLTTLFHRFERVCFGWDAQQPRALAVVLAMGIDGVYSDHVDRLMEAIAHQAS